MKEKKCAIAIDIGGTNTPVALMDNNAKIIETKNLKTIKDMQDHSKQIIDVIKKFQKKCAEKACGDECEGIQGIGIGVPGTIDFEKRIVTNASNLRGIKNYPIARILEEATGLQVKLENDANCALIAEHMHGTAKGCSNAIILTLGTGIGGGIMINNKIFHGKDGAAGELGHITINPNGFECKCGNKGCLEAYASSKNIARRERRSTFHIFEAAERGDRESKKILGKAGYHIAIGISSFINIFNPDIVIIAGGFSNATKYFLPIIKREINKRVISEPARNVQIVRAKFGSEAGIIGAGSLWF